MERTEDVAVFAPVEGAATVSDEHTTIIDNSDGSDSPEHDDTTISVLTIASRPVAGLSMLAM